ncbi:hypothetical protein GQ43DRAFT_251677 [Delitschia confertaspora ATCC 74209]|uniref:Uncharacterized protein n=1 Tax=Delitschia confertaspora ATCC 74209 TaxID=1513339 RepID=A0A9P4JUK2_9PLEO|nr:hypothetical protein GQ43DRAFT_251677 [Delitschia confertaspora ATCC 74209]
MRRVTYIVLLLLFLCHTHIILLLRLYSLCSAFESQVLLCIVINDRQVSRRALFISPNEPSLCFPMNHIFALRPILSMRHDKSLPHIVTDAFPIICIFAITSFLARLSPQSSIQYS